MFRVWKYPSAIIKAKIGKANLPTFVIQCWLVIIVAHKWSNSMNAIAKTCRPKDVIPIFFFPQFINFFHSSFACHHLNTAARKQVDPCFPAVHRFTSARVYHDKRTISTIVDAQTGPGGATATGRRPRSRLGAGWFHRYFILMLPRTHPDRRGEVSKRCPKNRLARRSKGAYLSGVRRSHSGGKVPMDGILPRGLRRMVWNSLLTNRQAVK